MVGRGFDDRPERPERAVGTVINNGTTVRCRVIIENVGNAEELREKLA